jgi:hypothetical protein
MMSHAAAFNWTMSTTEDSMAPHSFRPWLRAALTYKENNFPKHLFDGQRDLLSLSHISSK